VEKPLLVHYVTKKRIGTIQIIPLNSKAALRKTIKMIKNNRSSNNDIAIVILTLW
jgi:hypothetical protein